MSRIMFITNRNSVQCISMCFSQPYYVVLRSLFNSACFYTNLKNQLLYKCIVTDQSHNYKEITEGRYQILFEKVLQAFGLSTRCVTK